MNNDNNEVFSFGAANGEENVINLEGVNETNFEDSNIFSQDVDQNDSSVYDMKTEQNNLSFDNQAFDSGVSEDNVVDLNNIGDSSDFVNAEANPADSIEPASSDTLSSEEVYPFDYFKNNESSEQNDNQQAEGVELFYSNPDFSSETASSVQDESLPDVINNPEESIDEQLVFDKDFWSDGSDEINKNDVESVSLTDGSEEVQDTEIVPPVESEETINSVDNFEGDDDKEDLVNNLPEITPLTQDDEVEITDTSTEELNKLAEFEDEEVDSTDIDSVFDKISTNVKEASDIFKKNTDMKKKLDSRFKDLKELQSELDIKKKSQIEEIDSYKEEVFEKLNKKKEEIEERLNLLKDEQARQIKEKEEFEEYKKSEYENIERIKNEVQSAYDERREELTKVEDALRKQRELLDDERNQLSLDKIQYEADKNELANNLLKFNELVDQFTKGVNVEN